MKKNYLKNTFKIIKFNLKTLIKFELFYKFILAIILIPMVIGIFNLTMNLTGYTYLTIENILSFLLNPITIILLLLLIIFLTIITLFDISTLIVIFDLSYHEKKISVKEAIKVSISRCKNVFKLKNISVAFLVLFLIPFVNLGLSSNVITSIKIPEFIMDFIVSNKTLFILYIILYLFLISLISKWLYSLYYLIIENKSFKESRKASKELIKGNKILDIIKILFAQFLLFVTYILFLLIGLVIVIVLNNILTHLKIVESILITLVWLFIGISLIIASIVSNGVSYAIISSLFYKHKLDKGENIVPIKYEQIIKEKKKNNILKWSLVVISLFTVIGGTVLTYQIVSGKANLNIEYVRNMEITAHRGASVKYPENTMAAFRGAKKLGADWIELDVQQTKDKQIVVSHDTNLKRVTGVDKDIIDMTYEEISKLDAGSFKGKEFTGEKIPLLTEVLEFADENNIRLNIELKPTGEEIDFEKQVVELIKEYNMKDRCVVTSQVYEVLEKVKKYDKNIKTVYVMSIAIGDITDLKYADSFSVEASNVTEALVNKVHNVGKELYAWTVNTKESINNMIDMNVDNIITDNIELGKKTVSESKHSNIITEFLKLLQQ